MSYLREFSAQVSQILFLADLTVLRLVRTVWSKMSQILYLFEFSVQVWHIVFLAHLTVLRPLTTVWVETSKTSYVREFRAQVSQIVILAHLTVLQLFSSLTWKIGYFFLYFIKGGTPWKYFGKLKFWKWLKVTFFVLNEATMTILQTELGCDQYFPI